MINITSASRIEYDNNSIINTVEINGTTYFVANQIAKILGYGNNMRRNIQREVKPINKLAIKESEYTDTKTVNDIWKGNDHQFKQFIDIYGVHSLVIKSSSADALTLQNYCKYLAGYSVDVSDMVTASKRQKKAKKANKVAKNHANSLMQEVGTMIGNGIGKDKNNLANSDANNELPKDYLSALKALVKSVEREYALQDENNTLKTDAEIANSLTTGNDDINISELANIIQENGRQDLGTHNLYNYLRNSGYLVKGGRNQNMPTDKSKRLGLFRTVYSNIYIAKRKRIEPKGQTLAKPKAITYFVKRLCR